MSDATLPPLKTWSHLVGARRKPSEYEIVSTNLLWHTRDAEQPWEMGEGGFMSDWYRTYRNGSPLQHDDWDLFRDPSQLVYRSYNAVQDEQEAYVDGLLDSFNERGHDAQLSEEWLAVLGDLYTPGRYLLHTVQMASAYLVHIVPASTIGNCAAFQAADALRWVSRVAYRTCELAKAHPGMGFGQSERQRWETLPAWQGFRELMEKLLVAYDWAETFVALNVVAKPAIDESFWRSLGRAGQDNGDGLLAQLSDAALLDSERSKAWTRSLVAMILDVDGNRGVIEDWLAKWVPLAEQAVNHYCAPLLAGEAAVERMTAVRHDLGLQTP